MTLSEREDDKNTRNMSYNTSLKSFKLQQFASSEIQNIPNSKFRLYVNKSFFLIDFMK